MLKTFSFMWELRHVCVLNSFHLMLRSLSILVLWKVNDYCGEVCLNYHVDI